MKKSIFILLLCLWYGTAEAQSVPIAIANQWHFQADHAESGLGSSGHGWEWVFDIYPTDRKEYICVGYSAIPPQTTVPVFFKLDHKGKLVWMKRVEAFTFGGLTSNDNGSLYAVTKTPSGYAATGYLKESGTDRRLLLIAEFDEAGNYTNNFPKLFTPYGSYNSMSFEGSTGRTIAYSPDDEFIVGGEAYFSSSYPMLIKAMIAKIPYSSSTASGAWIGPGIGVGEEIHEDAGAQINPDGYRFKGGSRINKVLVEGGSGNYKIYGCGYQSMAGDNEEVEFNRAGIGTSAYYNNGYGFLWKRNKDILVVKLDDGLTEDYTATYDKTTNSGELDDVISDYSSTGPLSARGMQTDAYNAAYDLSTQSTDPSVDVLKDNLQESVNEDERGWDMIKIGNDLVVVALTNSIMANFSGNNFDNGNGQTFFHTAQNYIPNLFHTITDAYYGYIDGDGYLLSIDEGDGSLNWAKNIGHISSKDCWPKLVYDKNHIVIAASNTDKVPTMTYPEGFNEAEWYDAFMICTPYQDNPGSTADHLHSTRTEKMHYATLHLQKLPTEDM